MKKILLLFLLIPLTCFASLESEINKVSLHRLRISTELRETAVFKVNDMIYFKYFGHINPFGEAVADIYNRLGVKSLCQGEILARGYSDKDVVKAWMRSPSHRAIIIDRDFKKIGCYSKGLYAACHFSN